MWKPGATPSEKVIGQTFERLFRLYKDRRIVVATFASNLNRTRMIIATAARFNRKVVLVGRSMIANVELADKLGYLDIPEGIDHLAPGGGPPSRQPRRRPDDRQPGGAFLRPCADEPRERTVR